ncbi:hypothetical protein Ancab_027957 [Ancistrocladus abbreviatus]
MVTNFNHFIDSVVMDTVKKGKGRQRLEMVKLEKENHLQVTFSKRRSGLFKKASELCTLCGAEAAIIIFSPGQKPFSFGHPSVDVVVDRYMATNPFTNIGANSAHHSATLDELNMEFDLCNDELQFERKRSEALNEMKKATYGQFWWEAPVEELGLQQLEELKVAMEELKVRVVQHMKQFMLLQNADKLLLEASNPPPLMGVNPAGGFNYPIFYHPYA